MRAALRLPLVLLTLAAAGLAGCAGGDDAPSADDGAIVPEAGALCGVVVDQTVVPVPDADVAVVEGPATRTAADGAFCLDGLPPGETFLTVSKPGHRTAQAVGLVPEDGAPAELVRVVLERLVGQEPAMEVVKFVGFYECGFGSQVIVDSCDFGVRTASDAVNDTTGVRLPRGVQQNANTLFLEIPTTVTSIVQEATWENPDVPQMMIELGSTPIDNSCDCSDRYYLEVTGESPTYGFLDGSAVPAGETVAVRGFLPFGDPAVAVNHEFAVFTTLFHHVTPAEGWSFVRGDLRPF